MENNEIKKRYENLKKCLGEEKTNNLLDSILGIMAMSGLKEAQILQTSQEISELLDERIIKQTIISNLREHENISDEKLEYMLTFVKNIKKQIINFTETLQ